MKLNIGCGKNKLRGFINLDISANVDPDIVRDIERGLPFSDNVFEEVVGSHTLEHIKDLVFVMNEIWRVCKPGAHVRLTVPYYKSPAAFRDPTHVRFFTEDSLQYFCGFVDDFSDYGIKCRFELVEQEICEECELRAVLRVVKPVTDEQANLFESVQAAEVAELQHDLEARDAHIRVLHASLEEKTAEDQELQVSLEEKNAQAQALEASLEEKTAQAQALYGELASIKQSLIWRAAIKFQSLVDRFLPLGTRRRGLYELGLAAIRVIINEGWRSFWVKAKRRLKLTKGHRSLEQEFAKRGPWVTRFPIDDKPYVRKLSKQGIICLQPFHAMSFLQNYDVYNCVCSDWIKYSIGDLKCNTIAEIWNSDAARWIRRKMYDGQWQEICNPICPIVIDHIRFNRFIKYEELENIELLTPELIHEIRSGKDYLESPPTLFKLDNSNVCNLRCIMCPRDVFEDDPTLQKKLMADLANYLPTARKLMLSGMGEPFARADTRDLLINHKGPIKFDLITNALLLPKYWEKIKHQKFGSLLISIDAATKETYEKIRVGGKWEDLLRSLSLIQENRNKFESITIHMTVMRSNYKEIPQFIDLAESYDFNAAFHGVRGDCGDENIFEVQDVEALKELRNIVINENSRKRNIEVSWWDLLTYLKLLGMKQNLV